jgi:hypothetical protein
MNVSQSRTHHQNLHQEKPNCSNCSSTAGIVKHRPKDVASVIKLDNTENPNIFFAEAIFAYQRTKHKTTGFLQHISIISVAEEDFVEQQHSLIVAKLLSKSSNIFSVYIVKHHRQKMGTASKYGILK